MNTIPFQEWAIDHAGIGADDFERLKLDAAFDLFVSRLEVAQVRGSDQPLATITPTAAGGNSRACTRRMLARLGYDQTELRVVHRLMAGSASGWPGLLRLYAAGSPPSATHREYVHRQVQVLSRHWEPGDATR